MVGGDPWSGAQPRLTAGAQARRQGGVAVSGNRAASRGQAVSCLRRGAARTCIRWPSLPCTLRISTGWSPAGPNQCGTPGVELGDLAGLHRDVVLAEDQPQLAASTYSHS